jgi:hypothetical protein
MAEYEDAGNYGDPGDSGFEVPPAPWQYGSDDGDEGSGGGSSGFGGNGDTDSSGSGGSSGFGDVGDTGGYSQGAGWDLMRQQYNDAGIGAGGTGPYSGYPGMDRGLPPDNAGINFPIDYSPPPGMGTDTDMGNPYEPIAPGTFGNLGVTVPLKRGGGGGGGRSYPSGPTIPPDVLRQFIDLLRYGGTLRI